jgi:hypothetical protein
MNTRKAQSSKKNSSGELLGGWMPRDWWGGGDAAPRKIRNRKNEAPLKKPEISASDPRVETYRRRLRWIRLVISDDVQNSRNAWSPVKLDLQMTLAGEEYFLTMCQALFREKTLKESLGERLEGEDLIRRLVDFWSQRPLNSDLLREAVEGTSLDFGGGND